ncbi:beta-2 adrenergic receptor-like [Amphiura filiformis]|uniref:beta-2 adrenergic receptor-like n=1 Tax=Amphiura filiformis TaxID=82378 RepID=UPI003B21F628
MWTLGMIGINRLIHITKPMWYQKIFTSWKLAILVVIPWVVPAAGLLICLAAGLVTFGYYRPGLSCGDNTIHDIVEYTIIINVVCALPILAIFGSYIWIYMHVKKHMQQQKQRLSQFSVTSDIELAIPEDPHDPNNVIAVRRRMQISKQEIEITKNLFVVVVGFFACFLPYIILRSIPRTPAIEHLYYYVKVIPWFNSAINFIIYAMKHPDFKVILRHMMRCSYADIPQPSPILKYLLSRKN